MSWLTCTGYVSTAGGSNVGGATKVTVAPSFVNAQMSERATRLCFTSPTMAMCMPSRAPRCWRIV
jgi:hypothetical protein